MYVVWVQGAMGAGVGVQVYTGWLDGFRKVVVVVVVAVVVAVVVPGVVVVVVVVVVGVVGVGSSLYLEVGS